MTTKAFRDIVDSQEFAVGTFLFEFATPGIGAILKQTGTEFVFVDMEHSGFSYETLKAILRSLHDAGIASLVRPPSAQYHDISRALDMGAQGIVPPMMTADLAESVVHSMKYPPLGGRGAIFAGAHDDYAAAPASDKIAEANRKTCFIALIESRQGVADMKRLAAMDGVDGFFVGHFDLSCDLGVPAQFDHPTFLAAFDRIVEIAGKHGKPIGRMVASVDEGIKLYEAGFRMLLYSSDVWLLQSALAQGVDGIRAHAAQQPRSRRGVKR